MLRSRKSKAERKRLRIEEEELARRWRQEAAAVAQVERGEVALARICPKHPWWAPRSMQRVSSFTLPRPDPSECDECAKERSAARNAARDFLELQHSDYNESRFPAKQRRLIQAANERHEERLRAAGVAIPGSDAETQALARIDELRDEERARAGDTFAVRRARARKWWGKQPRRAFVG
jgi:hypothetical protein